MPWSRFLLATLGAAMAATGCGGNTSDDASASTTSATVAESIATTVPTISTTIAAGIASTVPTTVAAPAPSTSIANAESFAMSGNPLEICAAANSRAAPAEDEWDGYVLNDVTIDGDSGSTRWLFCNDGAASNGGAVVLWSQDSVDWRLTELGFGSILHAGSVLDSVIFNDQEAEITYSSRITETELLARTTDGGLIWTTASTKSSGP